MDLNQLELHWVKLKHITNYLKQIILYQQKNLVGQNLIQTNVPDADSSKFRSYEYDADNLEEFLGFAVKIVMKSKDTTQPCAIRAFRGLALA